MSGVLCTPEQASCLIPHLIVELLPPCPLDGAGGFVLCGLGYNGQKVTIRVLEGVLEIEGVPAEEVEALRERRCVNCVCCEARGADNRREGQGPGKPYPDCHQ